MKKSIYIMLTVFLSVLFLAFTFNTPTAGNKYVGAKKCGMCHKSKTGNQYKIWQKSAHAKAFEALKSDDAKKIAKANGIKDATKSDVCLKCHATAGTETAMRDKKFKVENGVQCESCHGAGSKYKSKKTMQDHAKAVAAGMTDFTKVKPESVCKNCHADEHPKEHKEMKFDFAKNWDKIKHPLPKK